SRRRRTRAAIERRCDAERHRHRGSEPHHQSCASGGDPDAPDSQDPGDAEEELSCRRRPRQKRDRGWWHEGVYFGRVAYKACEIPVTDISPTVKSKPVSNPRQECSTNRNARTQSRPT